MHHKHVATVVAEKELETVERTRWHQNQLVVKRFDPHVHGVLEFRPRCWWPTLSLLDRCKVITNIYCEKDSSPADYMSN